MIGRPAGNHAYITGAGNTRFGRLETSGPLELMAQSLGGIAGEIARRAVGRRPVSKPAAGA